MRTSLAATLIGTALLVPVAAQASPRPVIHPATSCQPGTDIAVSGRVPGVANVEVSLWALPAQSAENFEVLDYRKTYRVNESFDLTLKLPKFDPAKDYLTVLTHPSATAPTTLRLKKAQEALPQETGVLPPEQEAALRAEFDAALKAEDAFQAATTLSLITKTCGDAPKPRLVVTPNLGLPG